MERDLDIVVYGATGFTGRLVAEYLAAGGAENRRWAIAGRSLDRLESVRTDIGAPADLPLIIADADTPDSLEAMSRRTRLVLTTVGPYQLHGSALVAACARAGTDYVDLCGEPPWMREMIDLHEEEARASGARIVFSCGFDSIPFDYGVWTLQEQAIARFARPCPRVRCRVRKMEGGFSGGTAASLRATVAAAARNPAIFGLLGNPFALTPGFSGPRQPAGLVPEYDRTIAAWVAPFIMAPINTKTVHRTSFLLDHRYGTDFTYDEMIVAPGLGEMGKAAAEAIARFNPFAREDGPKPGEGPSAEERAAGFFDLIFIGEMPGGERLEVVVTGDEDPGYGATSKMISQAALAVLDSDGPGGIWTPAALLGRPLRQRLETKAGIQVRC